MSGQEESGGVAPAQTADTNTGAAALNGKPAESDARERTRQDILTPSAVEARELEQFIDTGHRSPHTLLLFSVLGVVVLIIGLLYFQKLDFYPEGGSWRQFGDESLPFMVENQAKREWGAYRLQPNVVSPPDAPGWPLVLYTKLRLDIYIVAGLVLVLCWVLMRIERAKSRRNDLLAFRALAREIEKLRLRVRELEGGKDEKK